MGLETQSKKFSIVLNIPKDIDTRLFVKRVELVCKSVFEEYSLILHDKDYTNEGVLKVSHIHIVALTEGRKRLVTVINLLGNKLEIDNRLISCRKCLNYVSSLQYLIHKNDLDKYQYKIEEILTSLPNEELRTFIENEENDIITFDRLLYIVKHSKCLTEIIEQVGLRHYIGYRNVIKDLWNERYLQND